MKPILIVFSLLIAASSLAQSNDKLFKHLSFEQALQQAESENKLLLIDCKTSWCAPCKLMETKEFVKQEAFDYFTPKFVCVTYDMEKGEGITLSKKFQTKSYPTFIVTDSNGKELHRVIGASKLPDFIKKIDRALDKNTALSNLDKRYKNSTLENKYYNNYKIALVNAGRKAEADMLLNQLWDKLSVAEKTMPEYHWIYTDAGMTDINSKYFKFVKTHIKEFKQQDAKWLSSYLYQKYLPVIDSYIYGNVKENADYDIKNLDKLMQDINSWNLDNKIKMLSLCELAKVRCENNAAEIIKAMHKLEPQLNSGEYMRLLAGMHIVAENVSKQKLAEAVEILQKARNKTTKNSEKTNLSNFIEQYQKQIHKGILFENLSLKQALVKAEKQNKLIFIDAYAQWCGPCKQMFNNVFTQVKVGDFINPKFISLKIDMEKGEGKEIAKKYGVRAYPTYLIIRPNGLLQYSFSSSMDAENFIAEVSKGLDEKNSINLQMQKYNAGNRTKQFLNSYAKLLFKKGHPDAYKVAAQLLSYLNDREKISKKYWYIYDQSLPMKNFENDEKFLISNIDKFYKTIGRDSVNNSLSMAYRLKILYSINYPEYKLTKNQLNAIEEKIKKLKFDDERMLLAFVNIGNVVMQNNKNLFLQTCQTESSSRLSAETFPYMDLTEFALSGADEKQRQTWFDIGKKLYTQMQESRKRRYLKGFLKKIITDNQ